MYNGVQDSLAVYVFHRTSPSSLVSMSDQ